MASKITQTMKDEAEGRTYTLEFDGNYSMVMIPLDPTQTIFVLLNNGDVREDSRSCYVGVPIMTKFPYGASPNEFITRIRSNSTEPGIDLLIIKTALGMGLAAMSLSCDSNTIQQRPHFVPLAAYAL